MYILKNLTLKNLFFFSPNQAEVVKGLVIPWCSGCGSRELLQVIWEQSLRNLPSQDCSNTVLSENILTRFNKNTSE